MYLIFCKSCIISFNIVATHLFEDFDQGIFFHCNFNFEYFIYKIHQKISCKQ